MTKLRKAKTLSPLIGAIEQALRPGQFIRYDDMFEFVRGLERVQGELTAMVDSGHANEAVSLHAETKAFGRDKFDKVKYRGTKILWPYFLVQVALLREFASTQPTSAKDHACLYTLEHMIDSAMQDQTPSSARYCLEWVRHFPGFTQDYLTEFISEQTWHFVYKTKKGKSRFDSLPRILRTLHWFSEEYRAFEKQVRNEAKARNCDPQSLEMKREWPNFKW